MSFMRGFAQGFVKSYSEVQKQEAEKEALLEKALFDKFVTAKAKYDKDALEDATRVKTAKDITGEFPNAPEGAWANVYNWLAQGRTVENIRQDLQTGTWTTSTRASATGTGTTATGPGNVDQQTADSGVAAGEVQTFPVRTNASTAAAPAAPAADGGGGADPIGTVVAQRSPSMGGTPPRAPSAAPSTPPAPPPPPQEKPGFFETLKRELTMTPADRARRNVSAAVGGDGSIDRVMAGYKPQTVTPTATFNAKPKDDKLTPAEVASEISRLQLAAASGDPAAVRRWEEYSTKELPIKMNALRTANASSDPLIQAYDDLEAARRTGDKGKIDQAAGRLNGIINVKARASGQNQNAEPLSFVRIKPDGTPEYVQGIRVSTGDGFSMQDSEGKPLDPKQGWRIETKDEREAYEAIYKTRQNEFAKYNTDVAGVADALRLTGQLSAVVDKDPRVLTNVAGITKKLQGFATEINTAFDIVGNLARNRDANMPLSLREVEASLREGGILKPNQTLEQFANQAVPDVVNIGSDARALATATSIFQSKLLLTAFRVGSLEGQGGNAMSNKDFDRIVQIVKNSSNAATFKQGLSDYMYGRVQNINDRASALNTDTEGSVARFKQRYGYSPLAAVKTMDQLVDTRGDMDLKQGFRSVMYTPVGRTKDGKIVYKSRTDGQNYTLD